MLRHPGKRGVNGAKNARLPATENDMKSRQANTRVSESEASRQLESDRTTKRTHKNAPSKGKKSFITTSNMEIDVQRRALDNEKTKLTPTNFTIFFLQSKSDFQVFAL